MYKVCPILFKGRFLYSSTVTLLQIGVSRSLVRKIQGLIAVLDSLILYQCSYVSLRCSDREGNLCVIKIQMSGRME